tara:strand:+ start:1008 stop:1208 length:201 start_codon:yes stop_codon:yes gene_type:complete
MVSGGFDSPQFTTTKQNERSGQKCKPCLITKLLRKDVIDATADASIGKTILVLTAVKASGKYYGGG